MLIKGGVIMVFVEAYGIWVDGSALRIEEELKKLPFKKDEVIFNVILHSRTRDLNENDAPYIKITGHEAYTKHVKDALKNLNYKLCIVNV